MKNNDKVSDHEENIVNTKAVGNDDEETFPEDNDLNEVIDDLDLLDALVEAESTPTIVSFTAHTVVATRPTPLASMVAHQPPASMVCHPASKVCHQLTPAGPAWRLDGQYSILTFPPPSSLAKSSILPDSTFIKVMENMEEEDFSDEEEVEEPNMFSPPPHAAIPGLRASYAPEVLTRAQ